MKSIFLSCHFGAPDDVLVRKVIRLLESHNLRVVMGDDLGGQGLTDGIKNLIEASDVCVALMTKRLSGNTSGNTHPWVVGEYSYAMAKDKPSIRLVWPDVSVDGMYAEAEQIRVAPDGEIDAFVKLSRTIGLWKAEAGNLIKVQVLPTDIAQQLAFSHGAAEGKFCLYHDDGTHGEWKNGRIVAEGEGTYIYLPGVHEGKRIQIKATCNGHTWKSLVVPQSFPVELH